MALSAGTIRSLRLARMLAMLVLAGLFIGALFSVPAPYKDTLRGHVDRAKLIATDDTARAEAIEYVSGQMSLLSVVMADIRRVTRAELLRVRVRATAHL